MKLEHQAIVAAVIGRINERLIAGERSKILKVTDAELLACEEAVVENRLMRGLDPYPFCDEHGYLLFKNVGLHT